MITHRGGCHCGKVKFEVDAPEVITVTECNCSMCRKSGYLALIVLRRYFRLVQGQDALATYQFNTGQAKHTFCSNCGMKSFYTPRSHPDGISVNVRCLDEGTIKELNVLQTDGQNWEQQYRDGTDNPFPNFPDHKRDQVT